MASFLMALLWWRYLWPRSFMTRWQGERPLGGGAGKAWRRIACVIVIGLALQVVVGYVTDAVLSLLPEAAADYSELVEETGMGDTSYLAVLTTVLGAPFCEELLVRGIIFEFSLRAFNPQCRPLWKRRRRANAQDSAIVPWAAPSTWGIAAAIVLQAAIFGFMHMNWVQGVYAFFGGLVLGWVAHHYKSVVFSYDHALCRQQLFHIRRRLCPGLDSGEFPVCDIADCDSGSIGSRIDFMAHRCGEKTAGAQSERFRISVFGVCAHTVRDKNRFLLVQEPVFWWGKANPIDFFTRSCYNKVIIFCKRGMGKCQ